MSCNVHNIRTTDTMKQKQNSIPLNLPEIVQRCGELIPNFDMFRQLALPLRPHLCRIEKILHPAMPQRFQPILKRRQTLPAPIQKILTAEKMISSSFSKKVSKINWKSSHLSFNNTIVWAICSSADGFQNFVASKFKYFCDSNTPTAFSNLPERGPNDTGSSAWCSAR